MLVVPLSFSDAANTCACDDDDEADDDDECEEAGGYSSNQLPEAAERWRTPVDAWDWRDEGSNETVRCREQSSDSQYPSCHLCIATFISSSMF